MLTVAILINGQPLVARSAVNQCRMNDSGETAYRVDTGAIIYHRPEEGAVELAKKLLDTIYEEI